MAAGGPAGNTRAMCDGTATERPAPSVTLAACAGNGKGSAQVADSPARSLRRLNSIAYRKPPNLVRSSHLPDIRKPAATASSAAVGGGDGHRQSRQGPTIQTGCYLIPGDYIAPSQGGVAEWLKAHAWKACIRETVSRVRIPLPPPEASFASVRSPSLKFMK